MAPPIVESPSSVTAAALCAEWGVSARQLARYERDPKDPLKAYSPGGWKKVYLRSEVEAWLRRRPALPGARPSRNPELNAPKSRKGKRGRRARA